MKNKKVNQGFPCFPRIAQKRGWLRILEATIAIMLISGVLMVVYTNRVPQEDISERVYSLQKEVLMDIALDDTLRENVLNGEEVKLNEFADTKIPLSFNFRVKVCVLGSPIGCGLTEDDLREVGNNDIYVEDTIIAGKFNKYSPKKVRLFVWEQFRGDLGVTSS